MSLIIVILTPFNSPYKARQPLSVHPHIIVTLTGFLNYYDACSEGLKAAHPSLILGTPANGWCGYNPASYCYVSPQNTLSINHWSKIETVTTLYQWYQLFHWGERSPC